MTLILKSINETDSIFTFEAGDIMDITSKGDEGKPFLNIDFHDKDTIILTVNPFKFRSGYEEKK